MQVNPVIIYSLLGSGSLLCGSLLPSMMTIRNKWISATKHFAAGVVLAAVATELLPKVLQTGRTFDISIGFIIGFLFMLIIRSFSRKLDTLTTAVGIDLTIDGVLIGLSFLAGNETGKLIGLALAIEALFLGLSVSVSLKKSIFPTMCFLALLIPIGAITGFLVLSQLPTAFLIGILSFGVAALLYLVAEELLLEAHETQDTAWITSFFFLGFLVIMLL